MNLFNCKVSKQPNGSTLYLIFQGVEQAILDAFNTLWQVNCFSGELEWLSDECAVVVSNSEQVKRGLFYREYLHLTEGDDKVAFAKQRAKEQADKLWESMDLVRIVTPFSTFAPFFYPVDTKVSAPEWQCEKVDEVVS